MNLGFNHNYSSSQMHQVEVHLCGRVVSMVSWGLQDLLSHRQAGVVKLGSCDGY